MVTAGRQGRGQGWEKRVLHCLSLVTRFVKDQTSADVRRGLEVSHLTLLPLIFVQNRVERRGAKHGLCLFSLIHMW
jgi:hypothetical protein